MTKKKKLLELLNLMFKFLNENKTDYKVYIIGDFNIRSEFREEIYKIAAQHNISIIADNDSHFLQKNENLFEEFNFFDIKYEDDKIKITYDREYLLETNLLKNLFPELNMGRPTLDLILFIDSK